MSFRLVILLKAQLDMADAVDWYEEQQTGLGEKFILFIDAFLKK